MRLLCVSAPLPGHLDWGGYLETAGALQARGQTVLWASGPAVRSQIEAADLSFHALAETGWRWPPPPPLTPQSAGDPHTFQRLRQLRSLDQWLEVPRVAAATTALAALIDEFQPDAVACEMFMAAAALAAEQAQLPLIVAGWPAPSGAPVAKPDPMVALGRDRLQALLDQFDVAGRYWTAAGPPALASPDLHISYWSPRWFGEAASASQTLHVGGIAKPPQPRPLDLPDPALRPWVFITLGTAFNQDPNFFIAASHAVARHGAVPIIALGPDPGGRLDQRLHGRVAAASCMAERVAFSSVLPYCAAAIHHGGAGTTHALVTHGIPQAVVPHAADQVRQAQGVARTGCGYHIAPRQATVDNLSAALAQMLPEASPQRRKADLLQQEFAELGGIQRAADAIEATAIRSPSDP